MEVEGIVAAWASCGEVEEKLVFQPKGVRRPCRLHAAVLRLYQFVPVDHKEVRSTYETSTYIHASGLFVSLFCMPARCPHCLCFVGNIRTCAWYMAVYGREFG